MNGSTCDIATGNCKGRRAVWKLRPVSACALRRRVLLSRGLEPNSASPGPHPPAAPLPLPPLWMPAAEPGAVPIWYYAAAPPGTSQRKPRIWTVFLAFAVAFLAFIVAQFVVLGIAALLLMKGGESFSSSRDFVEALQQVIVEPKVVILFGLLSQMIILGVAVVAVYFSPVPMVRRLRLGRSKLPLWAYPLVIGGALAIAVFYGPIAEFITRRLHAPGGTLKLLEDVLTHLTPAQAVAAVLVVGVLPGLAEEWLFRGYIQTRLSERLGRWWAIVITALLFGLMHLDPVQSPFAAIFGVYLGYLAEQSGSIRPTMVCHMANNTFQVLLAVSVKSQTAPSQSQERAVFIASAILLAGSVVYLHFNGRKWNTVNSATPASSFPS